MIKNISFNGYTAQPSDYASPDGDLDLSLNLISEDGAVRPLAPGSVIRSYPPGISPVFIHAAPSGRRFIIFFKAAERALFAADASASLDVAPPETPFYTLAEGVSLISFTSIGNTLCILTSEGIVYALIKDNSYRVLGSHLPEIRLNALLSGHNQAVDGDILEFPESQNFSLEFTEANRKYATERIIGWTNKFIAEAHENSHFVQPFFLRFALRLYDGSLAMHTPPALFFPVLGQNPAVSFSPSSKRAFVSGIVADLCVTLADNSFPDTLKLWSDIVRSVDVFVSAPLYTYDQNGSVSHFGDDFSRLGDSYANVNADSKTTNKDLISLASNRIPLNDFLQYPHSLDSDTIALPHHSLEDFTDTVRSCANFYLIHSIPVEKATAVLGAPSHYTPLEIPKGTLSSLLSRETMSDDFNSHDRIIPRLAFTYNSRLNIADISRRTPAVVDNPAAFHTVDFAGQTADGSLPYPHVTPYVFLSVDGHTSVVEGASFCLPQTAPLPFVYHPDRDAFRIVLVRRLSASDSPQWLSASDSPQWLSFDLRPHDFLNGAAYVSANLFSKSLPSWSSALLPAELTGAVSFAERRQPSRIYTSSVGNPFFFPVTGINAVGSGRILGISSAAKALSQGQFGQFPLYAFCSDGVWALSVSSTGAFSAVQPITRDVLLEGTRPLQLDSEVIFPTDRGLMLLSGSSAQCISDIINSDKPFDITLLPGMTKLHASLGHGSDTCLPVAPFLDFIAGCGMLYDYVHQRVIVYNSHYTYAYVFSLKSKLWGMMFSTIENGMNFYPEALAVTHDGALLDFSSAQGRAPMGLLVTRPLKLDAPDLLKTVDTAIIRGLFRKGHVQCALYASRDLFSWHLVWSSADHFLRGFRGTPYRFFRLALVCSLSPDESVSGATLQFNPRLTNRQR